MREILFRGKDIKGNWYEGLLTHNIAKDEWYISNKAGIPTAYQVRPETIGQYTGLTDKNGIRIFEGDILSFDYYPYTSDGNQNYYAEIVWVDENAAFCLYTFKNPTSKVCGVSEGCDYIEDFASDVGEIIGNRYDNPELLGGGNNDQR